MFAEKLDGFFEIEDFALPCSWTPAAGGEETIANVILDAPDVVDLGAALSREYEMTYPSAALPGLRRGEQVLIESRLYTVRDVQAEGDGAISAAKLSLD
ncbi:MAG: hypothetical protein ACHBMF_03750 [Chromatiales bacterium]